MAAGRAPLIGAIGAEVARSHQVGVGSTLSTFSRCSTARAKCTPDVEALSSDNNKDVTHVMANRGLGKRTHKLATGGRPRFKAPA